MHVWGRLCLLLALRTGWEDKGRGSRDLGLIEMEEGPGKMKVALESRM